eukprot:4183552-Prymnesium_polylepis.2
MASMPLSHRSSRAPRAPFVHIGYGMPPKKRSDRGRHAYKSGRRDRRVGGGNPPPAERESTQREGPVEDDEELVSPAPRQRATATPTTERRGPAVGTWRSDLLWQQWSDPRNAASQDVGRA